MVKRPGETVSWETEEVDVRDVGCEMDKTGSGSCPIKMMGISDVET